MSIFSLPRWVKQHMYVNKTFDLLAAQELETLRSRLAAFSSEKPDVSVVIPAWNEENNIFRTLSSLAANITTLRVEIIVVNNNSTDRTQELLDLLGVRSYFQPEQGISFARQLGLLKARGKYHLCADSDTIYPPFWIESMVKPMMTNEEIVGVYGRYSFIPSKKNHSRLLYRIYEAFTGLLIRKNRKNQEFMNFLGFNMGFVTRIAKETAGFKVNNARVFDNAKGSESYAAESEDGRMAQRLLTKGRLRLVTSQRARVYTSSRRLEAEGGLFRSFIDRFNRHANIFVKLKHTS